MKNPKNSRALNFREIRAFANLRENKVLAKIKCYTVAQAEIPFHYGTAVIDIPSELKLVYDRV